MALFILSCPGESDPALEQNLSKTHLDINNQYSSSATGQLGCTKTYLFTVAAKDLDGRFPKITTVCENCQVDREEDESEDPQGKNKKKAI